MNADYSITVESSQTINIDVKLQAMTDSSDSYALLDLKVYVLNYRPYFEGGAPFDQVI